MLLLILSVFNFFSIDSVVLHHDKVSPVVAGPEQIVTSFSDPKIDPDSLIRKNHPCNSCGIKQFYIANPFDRTVTANNIFNPDEKLKVMFGQSALPNLMSYSRGSELRGASVVIQDRNCITPVGIAFNKSHSGISNESTAGFTAIMPDRTTYDTSKDNPGGRKVASSNGVVLKTVAPAADEFYFQGNMDNVKITAGKNNSELFFHGWDALKSNSYVDGFYIHNINSSKPNSNKYAYQEIVADPVNPHVRVMNAVVVDDDPDKSGTSRAQLTLGFKDGVDLSVYHTSHRMYLNPDIRFLETYPSSITWFVLSEIWADDGIQSGIFPDGDQAGSARWGFTLRKEPGNGQSLFWRIKAEYMQPENLAYNSIWTYENRTVPIPFGKWFTLDIYMKRGDAANGKYKITMTIDGQQPVVLFDVNGSTIYPGHPELKITNWQNFKLYLDDKYLDYMRTNNKKISVYYNDFKWYKN